MTMGDGHHPLAQRDIGPHTLRHAFITAALDAGVPLRDVQEAASHADPRTTMRYDRARASLDRHATYHRRRLCRRRRAITADCSAANSAWSAQSGQAEALAGEQRALPTP
jgi:integrase/recombinase XerD